MKIAAILQEYRALSGLPFLALEDAAPRVEAWYRVLKSLTIEELDAAYERAVADYSTTNREPFSASHILDAHRRIKRERAVDREQERTQALIRKVAEAYVRVERPSLDELLEMLAEAKAEAELKAVAP